MYNDPAPQPSNRRPIAKWATLVAVQSVSAVFFLGDVLVDLHGSGLDHHILFEALATLALICGVLAGSLELRKLLRRVDQADADLRDAVGTFSAMVQVRFQSWSLTPSEAEVAMLLLKGFDISEIAGLRQTAPGTVRAQLSSIYHKSGHSSRGRFVSSFLDALIDTPIPQKAVVQDL